MKLLSRPRTRILRIAAYTALVGLALMTWPLFDYHPLAIVIAMSVGQALGTLSLLLFLAMVVADLFAKGVLTDNPKDATRTSLPPPPPRGDEGAAEEPTEPEG
jgi:hypothetical protein